MNQVTLSLPHYDKLRDQSKELSELKECHKMPVILINCDSPVHMDNPEFLSEDETVQLLQKANDRLSKANKKLRAQAKIVPTPMVITPKYCPEPLDTSDNYIILVIALVAVAGLVGYMYGVL